MRERERERERNREIIGSSVRADEMLKFPFISADYVDGLGDRPGAVLNVVQGEKVATFTAALCRDTSMVEIIELRS